MAKTYMKLDGDLVPVSLGTAETAETGGGGLTGGYSVIYSLYENRFFVWWISITLTFVDDTTASYEIKQGGSFPSDWEHQTGKPIDSAERMDRPYVWSNVKSVSITANDKYSSPYLYINSVSVGATYNATLDRNIVVRNAGGGGSN